MHISIDHDDTYTRDPKAWDRVIAILQAAGHTVFCVTMRYPRETITMPCPVHYTERQAKKPWCERMRIKVDVWIDDSPEWVLLDALGTDEPTPNFSIELQGIICDAIFGLEPPFAMWPQLLASDFGHGEPINPLPSASEAWVWNASLRQRSLKMLKALYASLKEAKAEHYSQLV